MSTSARLFEYIDVNPKERLAKGTLAKKISMDKLQPFCSDVPEYELAEFTGGSKFRNGDTIMARITPCLENGKTAMVNILDENEVGFGSTEYIVFRAKKGLTTPDFVYYLVCSSLVREPAIKSMVGSSGRQRVQTDVVSNLEIDFPALSEQVKIASVLKLLDDKIALNNKINNNLEQQAMALYKAWFVDFLPYNSVQPDNWTISTLGEVSNMGAGGDKPKIISTIQTKECPYPIYSNGLSENGLYGYTNTPKISDESVTVSARGTIGFVCIRHTPYVPIVRLVTLIPNTEKISAKYLYLYLKQLNITGTGTTQQQLTVPDFRKTEILVPDRETISSFTDIITPLFSKIWANEEENASLSATRDTLLPKLMSGELDVSDIDL